MRISQTVLSIAMSLSGLLACGVAASAGQTGHMPQGDAHAAHEHAAHPDVDRPAKDQALTRARVVAVDHARRRLTLDHEAITSMGMPAMTMPFPVGAGVALDGIQPGDAIRFGLKPNSLQIERLEPMP